jgi:hypothetical protein
MDMSGLGAVQTQEWVSAGWHGGRVVTGRGPIMASRRPELGEVIVAEEAVRRRSRQAVPWPKTVQFSLTQEEFGQLSSAATWAGWPGELFAAQVALAVTSGAQARTASSLRDTLDELMEAAGLVWRIGTNLNQAVAKLNATGQRSEDLLPAAEFCVRVIRRLDDAAEQVRRSVP